MKSIGIVGGMGPMATADLFRKIVSLTEADCDAQHIHIYIDDNTSIPDRTDAILHGGEDPRRELIRSAVKLECMGADFLVMPCNTAHYYYADVSRYVNIPFLNMIDETIKEVERRGISVVGLLATNGTLQSGVYENPFESHGIRVLKPSADAQRHVMDIIYKGIKAGHNLDITGFLSVLDDLESRGAKSLILGCTELPIAFEKYCITRETIDPTTVLAESAIRYAGKDVKLRNNASL